VTDRKRIAITGAGSGFDREASLVLAGRGHEVIAAVHLASPLELVREGFEVNVLAR
jgi:NAD(P)-dependent dehydrogenase (short-subunit alcohol dehydrogenase family)